MPSKTVNVSQESLDRYKTALGDVAQLKDTQNPPQPRVATSAEVFDHLMGMGKTFVLNYEQAKLVAANPPPQPQPVDLT